MDYTCETYNKFMQGADVFKEEDADYLNSLSELLFLILILYRENIQEVLSSWFSEKFQRVICI